ncbi:MAG: cytochrome c biogenesis protein CcdA [Clostridiales bacterium]|nr:cytochrome c biogenesis protein CcdA [Clostridiales bacterium]
MTEWLDIMGRAIGQSLWLGPLIALGAGLLTSLMPCSLTSIPLVIGYVGSASGEQADRGRALKLSLTFALGLTLVFTALGVVAASAGLLLGSFSRWGYLALGILMVLMALQTWELFTFIKPSHLVAKTNRQGYAGALMAGGLAGLFSSPCSTPVLIALLAMVAGQGQLARGILLLLLYAAGHSLLSVLAGTSTAFVKRLTQHPGYGRLSLVLRVVLGSLILLMGLYLLYLAM